MPRRAATVTQADISRAIRAAKAEGLPIARIVVRSDGVCVETSPSSEKERLADKNRVIVI